MNASFLIQGILLLCGLLFTRPYWRYFTTRTSLVFLLLAGIGWILAAVAPADVDENLHVLGALLIFFCGNLGLIFAERSRGKHDIHPLHTYARPLGAVGLVATALFLGQIYVVFGMGGMERFAAFPLQIWAMWTGVCLWRMRKQETFLRDTA